MSVINVSSFRYTDSSELASTLLSSGIKRPTPVKVPDPHPMLFVGFFAES